MRAKYRLNFPLCQSYNIGNVTKWECMKFQIVKRRALVLAAMLLLMNLILVLASSVQFADAKIAFSSERDGNFEIYFF